MTAEAIFGVDLNGNCTFCNPASLRLLGYERPDDLLGKNIHWKMHHSTSNGQHLPQEQCQIYQSMQCGEGAHVYNEVLWRRNSPKPEMPPSSRPD